MAENRRSGPVGMPGPKGADGTGGPGGSGGDGGIAFKYAFDTGTTATPAAGEIRYNNATPASVTMLYLNETDAASLNIDTYLDEIDVGDWLMVSNSDRSKYHMFLVSAQFTSGSGVDSIPVTYVVGTAAFSDADTVFFSRGTAEFGYRIGRILNLASYNYRR